MQPLPGADLHERLPGRRLHEGSRSPASCCTAPTPASAASTAPGTARTACRSTTRSAASSASATCATAASGSGRRRRACRPARRARSQIEIVNDRRVAGRERRQRPGAGPAVGRPEHLDHADHAAGAICRRTRGRSISCASRRRAPHWPLVVMTVLTQLSVGAFATIWLLQLLGASTRLGVAALTSLLVGTLALAASTLHLGRPVYAYRALKMWRRSWLSREVLLFAAFSAVAAVYAGALWIGLPGGVAGRRADRGARSRRRHRERLHLSGAVAAGVEHAVHAASSSFSRRPRSGRCSRPPSAPAIRAGWRVAAATMAGAELVRARAAVLPAERRRTAVELQASARLLSTTLALAPGRCAACCWRSARSRCRCSPAIRWRCGCRSLLALGGEIARPLPLLRQRRARSTWPRRMGSEAA